MAVPVFGSVAMDRGFMVPKLALAVLLAGPALAAALAGAQFGTGSCMDAHTRAAVVTMGAFVVIATVSTLWSTAPAAAFYGTQFRREGLLSWLACGALFAAAVLLVRTPGRARQLFDALIIGSVVPVAYSLQQRLGLDFYVFVISDPERVNGPFGNPNFLGAYLAMVLLPTLARLMTSGFALRERLPWGLLAAGQCAVLAATQSRGPVLALLAAGYVFAACVLARRGAWRSVAWLAVVPVSVFAGVLAVNLLDGPRNWAQHVSFVQRLVFEQGAGVTERTQASSRSIEIRFGLWQAGSSALADMTPRELLTGRGPDLAYEKGYRHLPESVMRLEGYWAVTNYDRLHADVYDIVLNYGVLGWLAYWAVFCLAMHGGARSVFGVQASGSALAWFAASLLAAVCAAVLARFLFPVLAAPAFGIGAAAGWIAMLARAGWCARDRSMATGGVGPDADSLLMRAALLSLLLVYWLDAQINVPILTTRLIAFVAAAVLVAAVDERLGDRRQGRPWVDDGVMAAATGLALAAAFVSFVSVVTGTEAAGGAAAASAWRPAAPLLALIGFAILVTVVAPTARTSRPAPEMLAPVRGLASIRRIWLWWGVAVLILAIAHLMLRVSWATREVEGFADGLRLAAMLPIFALPALCIGAGALAAFSRAPNGDRRAMNASAAAIVGAALFLGGGVAVARLIDAEVILQVSHWVNQPRPALATLLREEVVRRMPAEREFHRRRIFGLLEVALTRIRSNRKGLDWREFASELDAAETAGREAVARFPGDPWVMLALGNVLQVRALSGLRQFDPAGSDRAFADARVLFGRAREAFPVQPQVYRNWAQLEHDRGNTGLAESLLDRMEALIPAQAEPYVERITMARSRGDEAAITAILARAKMHVNPELLAQVTRVANLQQN
ncbi:MAG: O-antigen ligase family protein [Burkholderiales bacterium]